MSKARTWVLVVVVLVLGLAVGLALSALVPGGDGTRIRNVGLEVGDEAPDFRWTFFGDLLETHPDVKKPKKQMNNNLHT